MLRDSERRRPETDDVREMARLCLVVEVEGIVGSFLLGSLSLGVDVNMDGGDEEDMIR